MFNLLPLWAKALILAAIVSAVAGAFAAFVHHERGIGRDEIRAEWAKETARLKDAAFAEAQANAKETQRRLVNQQENQNALDQQLQAARRDADRNRTDADRLREQNATAARQWSAALGNPTASGVCKAAGTAIMVQADVLSRADRIAGELASFADAARAAGLKCAADYGALTP